MSPGSGRLLLLGVVASVPDRNPVTSYWMEKQASHGKWPVMGTAGEAASQAGVRAGLGPVVGGGAQGEVRGSFRGRGLEIGPVGRCRGSGQMSS